MAVDLVALNRDEPRANIRRTDIDLDIFPWCVVFFVQRELQFSVAVHAAREVGDASHAVVEPVQLQPVGVANHIGKGARGLG